MPPIRRSRKKRRARVYKKARTSKRLAKTIRRIANSVVNKNVETHKREYKADVSVMDGGEGFNRTVSKPYFLNPVYHIQNGPYEYHRLGDKIHLKGISLRLRLSPGDQNYDTWSNTRIRIVLFTSDHRSADGGDGPDWYYDSGLHDHLLNSYTNATSQFVDPMMAPLDTTSVTVHKEWFGSLKEFGVFNRGEGDLLYKGEIYKKFYWRINKSYQFEDVTEGATKSFGKGKQFYVALIAENPLRPVGSVGQPFLLVECLSCVYFKP